MGTKARDANAKGGRGGEEARKGAGEDKSDALKGRRIGRRGSEVNRRASNVGMAETCQRASDIKRRAR